MLKIYSSEILPSHGTKIEQANSSKECSKYAI